MSTSGAPSHASSGASAASAPSSGRGCFILLEGLDRSGKSSQCKRLAETLNQLNEKSSADPSSSPVAVPFRFPDRTTSIGVMLDSYLRSASECDDHAIHLLFSANRWEKNADMKATLMKGQHIVCDRYAYSGIAFTLSKETSLDLSVDGQPNGAPAGTSSEAGVSAATSAPRLTYDWCTSPDRGLLAPDVVIFLDITTEDAAKRGSYGVERYEKKEIQERVRQIFQRMREQPTGAGAKRESSQLSSSTNAFGAAVPWVVVNAGQSEEAVAKEILQIAQSTIQKAKTETLKFL
jgi:dTMP kinase